MSKQPPDNRIRIYARLRPTDQPARGAVNLVPIDQKLEFQFPKQDKLTGHVNNSRDRYEFKFDQIFDVDTKQDEVFSRVAQDVAKNALDGYNSTIFAYGQTGSGKTFTMTGGPTKYSDRGIIPRTLQYIFSEFANRTDYMYTAHISYLEIYMENAYDLLHPDHNNVKSIHDLPKVGMMENANGDFVLQGLSTRLATNEEEGLNILFLGDTNRAVAETPMNLESSRSHCIFTINISAQQPGSDRIRRSKLHLVDLAGSERVWKSAVEGSTLQEAKYINSSLFHLERVILCLREAETKGRTHIPYRDSLMTSLLRDSLGGNCKTCMIATISIEKANLLESVSTCRFAQRVALISNKATINMETDPFAVIKRLKREIIELKEELVLLRGDNANRGAITDSEKERLARQVKTFIEDASADSTLTIADPQAIREIYNIFKAMVIAMSKGGKSLGGLIDATFAGKSAPAAGKGAGKSDDRPPSAAASTEIVAAAAPQAASAATQQVAVALQEQIKKLQHQLHQRDVEINILLNMVKKKNPGASASLAIASGAGSSNGGAGNGDGVRASVDRLIGDHQSKLPLSPVKQAPIETLTNTALLMDRNRAFEEFRKSYRKNETIEENKQELQQKYAQAKALGEEVNRSRDQINSYKALIEQRRVERSMRTLVNKDGEPAVDAEEDRLKALIDKEKQKYKANFATLRDLKAEIESLQRLLQRSHQKLTTDFEQYYGILIRQQQAGQPEPTPQRATTPKTAAPPRQQAWKTPPPSAGDAGAQRVSLTGNSEADKEIAAFYEARERLLAKK